VRFGELDLDLCLGEVLIIPTGDCGALAGASPSSESAILLGADLRVGSPDPETETVPRGGDTSRPSE
jgi:hypothetical protein